MVDLLLGPLSDALELAGIAAITGGILWATTVAARRMLDGRMRPSAIFASYRRHIGQGILLGLELLVAADIIATLVVEPSLPGVATLGVIVLIRTFLSFSLEVELAGRWPWQPSRHLADATASNASQEQAQEE